MAVPFAVLLEAVQGLTADRVPDLPTALLRRRRRGLRGAARRAGFGCAKVARRLPTRAGKPERPLARGAEICCILPLMNSSARRRAIPVRIGNVTLGGDAPIVVQSMTNTDTADIEATTAQVAALARAGSELVRITVDRAEAAAAVPYIRERLDILGLGRAADRRLPL